MNWKPKNRVGKTLYMVRLNNIFPKDRNGNYCFEYNTWGNGWYYVPAITKFKDVQQILNGSTKSSIFIIAKKDKDTERKVYKLEKGLKLTKEGDKLVVFEGGGLLMTNDKTEIYIRLGALYRKKKQQSIIDSQIWRKKSEKGEDMWGNKLSESNRRWYEKVYFEQPQNVDKNYKQFIANLKKV